MTVEVLESVDKAVKTLKNAQPDILFLDIELQDGTGFDVLKAFESINSAVIFTTSHIQYAIEAIRFSAVDYLLKPFSKEELFQAINRAKEKLDKGLSPSNNLISNFKSENSANKRIGINTADELYFIKLKEIIFIRAEGSYTTVFLSSNEKIVASKPIKYFEELLIEYGFVRVHKSSIINLHKVKRYLKKNGGQVEMIGGEIVEVSRRKKDDLLNSLKNLTTN